MKFEIMFTEEDDQALVSFVNEHQGNIFVKNREERNVYGEIPKLSREIIWYTISMCLLTTQQRSGPNSRISRFLRTEPYPISLEACSSVDNIENYIQNTVKRFGGIRFGARIGKQINAIYILLNSDEWGTIDWYAAALKEQRCAQPNPKHFQLERNAAQYIQKSLPGFGPKQSRNFWQSLGLTRYEFVLDSRVLKWLRDIKFPIPLSSMALGEEKYYCFVSDILRNWCQRVGILPCIIDAAIFSSFDSGEWTDNNVIS